MQYFVFLQIPNDEDMIHLRTETAHFYEQTLQFDEIPFKLRDIGGQVQHQGQWIETLKGNSALLFVVSLDDYHVFDEDG